MIGRVIWSNSTLCRSSEPDERRPKPYSGGRRSRNHELLGPERIDNALHGGAREVDPQRDLAEAQAVRLALECPENIDGPGDDLDAVLG